MEEKRYIISEAAQKTGIEAHVLRYWEDELGLIIPRNEMGHRYYTENQLKMFKQIKELKESGFQLKAVKTVIDSDSEAPYDEQDELPEPETEAGLATCNEDEVKLKESEDKLARFEQIIGDIVSRTLIANNARLGQDISCLVSDEVSTKVIREMDYMMRMREEAEDERFRRFDETIRGMQKSNKEAAAFKEKKEKKKVRFFR